MGSIPKGFKGILIAPPIPVEFFVSTGIGESPNQIHAGSYHVAMRAAGVERGNLIPYTSILPPIAKEIPLEDGIRRIRHGSEIKVIQAASHVDLQSGEKRATSAILYSWLLPKDRRGPTIGGLVCEYNGHGTENEARDNLESCLEGLFKGTDRNGKSFADEYKLGRRRFISATIEPKERYGTALSVLAFVSYFIPVIDQNAFQSAEDASEFAQSAFGIRA